MKGILRFDKAGAMIGTSIHLQAARLLEACSPGGAPLDRQGTYAASSQVILAVLAVIAALYLLRMILVPMAVALVLACMLSPIAAFFRRWFPFGAAGALALFLLLLMGGLYVASLTAEGLLRATHTLPADIERLAGQVSARISDLARDQPYLPRCYQSPARSTVWAIPTVPS